MNSSFRNVQILVDLLKQYKIKDVVLSPGGSDIPLIHSIETDEYFTCFSVVDERSAAYFAMGVALQKMYPLHVCVHRELQFVTIFPVLPKRFIKAFRYLQ